MYVHALVLLLSFWFVVVRNRTRESWCCCSVVVDAAVVQLLARIISHLPLLTSNSQLYVRSIWSAQLSSAKTNQVLLLTMLGLGGGVVYFLGASTHPSHQSCSKSSNQG